MHPGLPTAALLACLALLIIACEDEPRPQDRSAEVPDAYLERLQEAEAVRYSIEQHNLEQRRLEQLLGTDHAAPPTR